MKRQKTGKHTVTFLIVTTLVFMLLAGGAAYIKIRTTTILLKPVTYSVKAPDMAHSDLAWPATGQAAVGIVGYGVLDSSGAQKPAPTASVAKLITALMVLQKKPLKVGEAGPSLTIGPDDIALYHSYVAQGGSVVPVNSGEQLSERDALIALLLPSANNIADSLVLWAFGSQDAYATYANAWLKSHNFQQTTVGSDASGLSATTTSTAKDLVGIGMLAHLNPVIAQIAGLDSAEIPVAGTVQNVNWLLGVEGINGLKTGNSDAAGGTFVFSADVAVSSTKTVTVVGAVLQAPDLKTALTSSRTLLQSATKAISYPVVVPSGAIVGQYNLPSPRVTSTAITKQSISVLAWNGRLLDKQVLALQTVSVPASANKVVGTLRYGTDKSQSSPVVLSDNLPQASWWYRLWH